MADKRVKLVKDGYTYAVPADDKVEINQAKARGFAVKGEDPTPFAPDAPAVEEKKGSKR